MKKSTELWGHSKREETSTLNLHHQGSGPNPFEEKFYSEMSLTSFLVGIVGILIPLFSPLAVIFGISGLMQTQRENMKGKWMAVTGIVLGFIGLIIILFAVFYGVSFLQDVLMGGLDGAAITEII